MPDFEASKGRVLVLCCICYRLPATIFKGRASYCSGCASPAPFLAKTAEEDAADLAEQEKLAVWKANAALKKSKHRSRDDK